MALETIYQRIANEILHENDFNSALQALAGTGWISGWGSPTLSGAAKTFTVPSGAGAIYGSRVHTDTTSGAITIASNATGNPRKDLLVMRAGTLTLLQGTAAAVTPAGETTPAKMVTPMPPDFDMADIPLWMIYVPNAFATASACTLIDRRVKASWGSTLLAFDDSVQSNNTSSFVEVKSFRFMKTSTFPYNYLYVVASLYVASGTGSLQIQVDSGSTVTLPTSTSTSEDAASIVEAVYDMSGVATGVHTIHIFLKNSGSAITYNKLIEITGAY